MREPAGWSTIPPNALPTVLMRAVAAAQSITICDADAPDAPLVYANQAFLDLTGYSHSEVLGRNCRFLQGPDTDPAAVATLHEAVHSGLEACTVLLNHRRDGTPFWNEVHLSPVKDADGHITHFIGYQVDVTERVEQAQVLAHQAHTDPLTGLSTRAHLIQQLDRRIQDSEEDVVVVLLDLRNFHRINESFDYQMGNLVLRGVAERLSAVADPDDQLAHLEADSFVLVRSAPAGHGAEVAAEAADQLLERLAAPIETPAVPIAVHAHHGIALHPDHGGTAAMLLGAARRDLQRRALS